MALPSKIRWEHIQKSFTDCASGAESDAAAEPLGLSSGSSEPEHNSYWFTSDHLGSSAFITDGSGVAIQHLEYMAFGEVFVDQRRTGFGTPYKFNAKELDCESGYYYYGARYYDPRMARFLSVDPVAGDMPSLTSYHYVHNTPLRYTDPRGMRAEEGDGVDNLILGGDRTRALRDIKSTVAPKYRDRITMDNDGLVSVNTDGLMLNELTGKVDAGLGTLINLTESSDNYVYSVSEMYDAYKIDGSVKSQYSGTSPDHVQSVNSSLSGEQIFENLGFETFNGQNNPIHGRVDIHPGMQTLSSDGLFQPRSSLIYHGLEEVFQRTSGKRPYVGAHRVSIEKANSSFYFKSANMKHGRSSSFKVF